MLVTILAEDETVRSLDLDPNFVLEELLEVLAAEIEIDCTKLVLYHDGKLLADKSKTLNQCGVKENDMLLLKSLNPSTTGLVQGEGRLEGSARESEIERSHPHLITAAINNPEEFTNLMRSFRAQLFANEREQATLQHRLYSNPFDAEAQKRIEEAIRQHNIAENMETAMEYHPESFGSVTMLYVLCKVNGKPIKAFVDCGAQTTIMTERCARQCGLDRLVDTRFSGIAKGVGISKIVGRVHSVQLQLGSLFLPCAVTIIEGNGPDMLLGLDMLKRHQCTIDMGRNVLSVNGEDIPYLPESEIPREEDI